LKGIENVCLSSHQGVDVKDVQYVIVGRIGNFPNTILAQEFAGEEQSLFVFTD
jgi:hypothetical protein